MARFYRVVVTVGVVAASILAGARVRADDQSSGRGEVEDVPPPPAESALVHVWVRDRDGRAGTVEALDGTSPTPLCHVPCVVDAAEGARLRVVFDGVGKETKVFTVAAGPARVTEVTTGRGESHTGLGVSLVVLGVIVTGLATTAAIGIADSSFFKNDLPMGIAIGHVVGGLVMTVTGIVLLASDPAPTTLDQRVSRAQRPPKALRLGFEF